MCFETRGFEQLSFKQSSQCAGFIRRLNEDVCGFQVPFQHDLSLSRFEKYFDEEKLVKEATYEHESDIGYVFSKYFDKFNMDFLKKQQEYMDRYKRSKLILFDEFSSESLPSDLAKQAHEINPITIRVGIFGKNTYEPVEKMIYLSCIPKALIEAMIKFDMTIEDLSKERKVEYKKYLKPTHQNPIIAHELAHWLDDSLRNKRVHKYLQKIEKKQLPYDEAQIRNLVSQIEIDGYIHTIKEYKKQISEKEWNKLTLMDLINQTSLDAVVAAIKNKEEQFKMKWKKRITKRMARENLWGPNMSSEELSLI